MLAALALGAVGIDTGLDDESMITGTPESLVGQRLLASHYPAGESRPIRVITDASAAARISSALGDVRGVARVRPPERSTDGRLVAVDAVPSDPADSSAARTTVQRVRSAMHDIPRARALVGGSSALDLDQTTAQAHDRRAVIPLVVAVVLVVLVVLLRALVAPLLLIATVIASYSAALGTSWLLFTHVFGFPAADLQLTLLGFLFLVALGVDYNIFLVSRIRQEATRNGHHAGVRRGLAATGGVITSAGIVVAATFAVLLILPLVAFVQIGVLVAVGVLLDTLLVRSVLVPALALDAGRWFWWPAPPARNVTDPQPTGRSTPPPTQARR